MSNPRFNKYGMPSRWKRTHVTGGALFGYGHGQSVPVHAPVETDFKQHGFEATGFNRYETTLPHGGGVIVSHEDGGWRARAWVFTAPADVHPDGIVAVATGMWAEFATRMVSPVESMTLPGWARETGWFFHNADGGTIYTKRSARGWEVWWQDDALLPSDISGAELLVALQDLFERRSFHR